MNEVFGNAARRISTREHQRVPLNVLMVEDSEDDALLISDELRSGGFETVFRRVASASEMESALNNGTWDLILADFQLPNFSGLEAFKIYRQRGLDIPFLIVSGTISEETAVSAMKAGVHDYLNKNNLHRLNPAVDRELREAEMRVERRRVEEEVRSAHRELAALYANAPAALLVVDEQIRIEKANDTATQLLGRSYSQLVGIRLCEAIGCSKGGQCPACSGVSDSINFGARNASTEIWVTASDAGRKRNRCLLISTAPLEVQGRKRALVCALDITDRKDAELQVIALNHDLDKRLQELEESLEQRNVLIREVQHRVKNNLQVISSLLSLESERFGEGEALTALQASRDRVRSMALMHDQFCHSQELAQIQFKDYVESLAQSFWTSYAAGLAGVQLRTDIDVTLAMDQAIPCGLIVQELLSNSMKYAFQGKGGEIRITFHCQENAFELMYRDSGVGLPSGIDLKNPGSLGLQLISVLVRQLRGQLTYRYEAGALFLIRFPAAGRQITPSLSRSAPA